MQTFNHPKELWDYVQGHVGDVSVRPMYSKIAGVMGQVPQIWICHKSWRDAGKVPDLTPNVLRALVAQLNTPTFVTMFGATEDKRGALCLWARQNLPPGFEVWYGDLLLHFEEFC